MSALFVHLIRLRPRPGVESWFWGTPLTRGGDVGPQAICQPRLPHIPHTHTHTHNAGVDWGPTQTSDTILMLHNAAIYWERLSFFSGLRHYTAMYGVIRFHGHKGCVNSFCRGCHLLALVTFLLSKVLVSCRLSCAVCVKMNMQSFKKPHRGELKKNKCEKINHQKDKRKLEFDTWDWVVPVLREDEHVFVFLSPSLEGFTGVTQVKRVAVDR